MKISCTVVTKGSQAARNILLLCSLGVAAAVGQTPGTIQKSPIFIAPEMVKAFVLITPPPRVDSKQMSKDIAEIYALHRSLAPEEKEKANFDNSHEDIFAIAMALSPKLTKESLPATAALWANMNNDQGIVVSAAKKFFAHPRPYDLDPNIKSLCGSKPGGAANSYPSGHATVGYLSALVLTLMVPEKGDMIRARAEEYAHNRVVCGDHYASDLRGSKEAAELIMGGMLGSLKFQKDFAAAKAEILQALR